MPQCSKCNESIKDGSVIIHNGVVYKFCKTCSDILFSFPSPETIVKTFLSPEENQSQVQRDIFEARKRRSQDIMIWK